MGKLENVKKRKKNLESDLEVNTEKVNNIKKKKNKLYIKIVIFVFFLFLF